jgi:adenylyltransferase/sulfurtransferase
VGSKTPIEIIDVRPQTEYGICQLPGSQSQPIRPHLILLFTLFSTIRRIDIPLKKIMSQPEKYLSAAADKDIYLVCRLGNDSQIAAQALRKVDNDRVIKDVIGGLRAWSNQVDPKFPVY